MKGFGGMPTNMQGILKQAQKIQKEMQRVNEECEAFTAEESSGGGAVRVVVNGRTEIETLEISAEVLAAGDREMLQDLIIAAANQALARVRQNTKEKLAQVTGGVNIPGL